MSHFRLIAYLTLMGAFVLAACGAAQKEGKPNADGSIDVDVTLTEFGIESSLTEFTPGVLYHFNVTNEGMIAHEFMILPVSEHMGMAGMTMEEYDEMALMMIPDEQSPAGALASADYTFATLPEGDLELVCMTAGHFEAGMRIPILVE